jgi:hypothetical protein
MPLVIQWLASSVSTGTNATPIGVSVLTRLSMEAFLSGTCILDSDQNQRPESTDSSIFVQHPFFLRISKNPRNFESCLYRVLTNMKISIPDVAK